MIKTIKAMLAVAALSGTVGANVQAAEVTVQKGDTLWNLSQVHNATVENFKKWNQLSTDIIHPGDVLTIPEEMHYEVKQGDTLWDIAKSNHVTVDQIMGWNQLKSELIQPGLNLVIYNNKTGSSPVELSNSKEEVSAIQANAENAKSPAVRAVPVASSLHTGENTTKEITVKATAYTASCTGCSGVTATGVNLKANPNAKVISVDPSVIPLGSKVYVEGYGVATAADTGGSIKGNRIDVFIPSQEDAVKWGAKEIKVKIIN
ncbi:LysM peptidoglycan-binding domain-containing protein [Bacillota bacterium Lsc_1132]